MRSILHPGVWPSLGSIRDTSLPLLLGGYLLVLVINGCTLGSQGTMRQHEPGLADDGRAGTTTRHQAGEGMTLGRLDNASCDRSQPANAIACYQRALVATYQQSTKGWLLLHLGWAYYDLGQYAAAIASYEQALAMARQAYDQTLEGASLQRLGLAYMGLGQSTTAIASFEQSLVIWRGRHDRAQERVALTHLGHVYAALGQYATAMASFEQAVAIARQAHDRAGEGWPLLQLGRVYAALGQDDQARVSLEQAVAVMREVRDGRGEVRSLIALGWAYHGLRQDDRAIASLEQALTMQREIGDRRGVGHTLHALGQVYDVLGQDDQARGLYEQALVAMREVGDREGEGRVFAALMAVWHAQHQPRLAIFYGKQAINVFQELRGQLRPLPDALQESFLTDKKPVYRALAEVLLAEGRLLEAQQVLDLLKAEEYGEFVRGEAGPATTLQGRAALTPEEAVWAQRYAAIADRVAALGAERGTLRAAPERTAAEDARLAQLEADLMAANWAFQRVLADLQMELGRAQLAQEKLFQLRETQGLMADLRDLGPGTVAVYTLVGTETSRVLLITPDVQLVREVPLPAADLRRKVLAFREVLAAVRQRPAPPDPRPLAHELYALLVGPIAAALRAVRARTLLWSLDGVLRYLPLAALYDGEHYLVERYALVVFTPASQPRWKDVPQPRRQALGLGVSKAHAPFPALPGVVRELQGIIRDPAQGATAGVLPGTIKLDEGIVKLTGER